MSKDGGPALPEYRLKGGGCLESATGSTFNPVGGMSLRDYFAIHGTQPGMSEIVKVAGFGLDQTNRVYTTEDAKNGVHFNQWWQSLTLERQCELSALVRYAQADAMLKARES